MRFGIENARIALKWYFFFFVFILFLISMLYLMDEYFDLDIFDGGFYELSIVAVFAAIAFAFIKAIALIVDVVSRYSK